MMNRSGKYRIRPRSKDIRYNSITIQLLINNIMKDGKKEVASRIVYGALKKAEEKYPEAGGAVEIINSCIKKVAPKIYLRSRRIASRMHRIPVQASSDMLNRIAIKWIKEAVRVRDGQKAVSKLFKELCAIMAEDKSYALKKKEQYQKIGKDNEAFVHYI